MPKFTTEELSEIKTLPDNFQKLVKSNFRFSAYQPDKEDDGGMQLMQDFKRDLEIVIGGQGDALNKLKNEVSKQIEVDVSAALNTFISGLEQIISDEYNIDKNSAQQRVQQIIRNYAQNPMYYTKIALSYKYSELVTAYPGLADAHHRFKCETLSWRLSIGKEETTYEHETGAWYAKQIKEGEQHYGEYEARDSVKFGTSTTHWELVEDGFRLQDLETTEQMDDMLFTVGAFEETLKAELAKTPEEKARLWKEAVSELENLLLSDKPLGKDPTEIEKNLKKIEKYINMLRKRFCPEGQDAQDDKWRLRNEYLAYVEIAFKFIDRATRTNSSSTVGFNAADCELHKEAKRLCAVEFKDAAKAIMEHAQEFLNVAMSDDPHTVIYREVLLRSNRDEISNCVDGLSGKGSVKACVSANNIIAWAKNKLAWLFKTPCSDILEAKKVIRKHSSH